MRFVPGDEVVVNNPFKTSVFKGKRGIIFDIALNHLYRVKLEDGSKSLFYDSEICDSKEYYLNKFDEELRKTTTGGRTSG